MSTNKSSKRNNTRKVPAGTLLRVLVLLKPAMGWVVLSFLLSICSVVCLLTVPVQIGGAIDLIIGPGETNLNGMLPYLVRAGLFAGLSGIFQWLLRMINNRISFKVVQDLRNDAFRKIQSLPLSYLDHKPVGELVSRVISDAEQLSDGLLLGFSQLFTGIATIVGTLIFMLILQPWIALAVVVLSPVSLFVARFISSRTHKYFLKQSKDRGEQTAFLNEMIENQKTVKAFGQEENVLSEFDTLNETLSASALIATFFSSLTNPTTRFVNSLVYASVALIGGLVCLSTGTNPGETAFTVGSLSALLAYANQYTKPFNEISGVLTELQNAFACASRVFEFLDEKEEPETDNPSVLPDPVRGDVQFEDVSFSYDKDRKLIEHLNVSVQPGQRVALVGPTGCGKTTLINLLMRFYDVDNGALLVEGEDIRALDRSDLRSHYGMVLQETWLKNGTVKENLLVGNPDATDEQIVEAAQAAYADGFIRRLPDGYETVLGEEGCELSEGQKQLLCIARIFLRVPPMLILDEATSSIDTRTELRIQEAFTTLMNGRTSFIVAHRLSTIREADLILVMKEGRIVEQGTHDQLLKKDGFYAELYDRSFSGSRDA